jgi:phage terminase large subunit-like protein
LLVAPSQNISERCFGQAQGMIRLDPTLRDIFRVQDHIKRISRKKTRTRLDVKTFDTSIVTGEIPILTIIDELHELGKKAKAASVMQQIRGGGITMQGGQVLMITTQSDEQPQGIWKTELMKARAIRAGRGGSAPIMLPVLYEFPQELQRTQDYWRNHSNWAPLLPNLGRSIDPQRLADDYENNGKANAEAEQIWASQHLNIEIGVGLGDDPWAGAVYWEERADASLTLDALLERSEVVTFGADGGGLDDLLGVAVMGREKVTRQWLLWNHAFAHEKVLTVREEIAARLRDFQEEGSLTVCGTAAELMQKFGALFGRVLASGKLPAKDGVGVDPNNAAALFEALFANGMGDKMLRRILQGPALSPAWWGMEMKLADATLWHSGLPMMNWVVGNAKIEPRGNGIIITKQQAGRAKIDPLIAAGQAAMLMSWNPTPQIVDFSEWLSNAVMA